MHSVIIGIGRHDDVVVAQVVKVVLDSEGRDQKVQFLVLSHFLVAFLVAVYRLATKTEHGLILSFSHLGDGSARGVSLSDEYARKFPEIFLALWQLVTVVKTAVSQLSVIDIRFLVPFPCLLLDSGDLLALGLRLLDLVLDDRDDVLVDAKIVVQISGDEVVDERSDRRSAVNLDRAVRIEDLLAVLVRLFLLPHVG